MRKIILIKKAVTVIQVICVIAVIGLIGTYENGGSFIELIKNSAFPWVVVIIGQIIRYEARKRKKFRVKNSDLYFIKQNTKKQMDLLRRA